MLGMFAILHANGLFLTVGGTSSANYNTYDNLRPVRFDTKEEAIEEARRHAAPMTVVELLPIGTTQTGFTYGYQLR